VSENGAGRGRFYVLDGVDGCGKSTQAERLVARLRSLGREVEHLREPGSTAVGERLRGILLDRELDPGPATELLLFAAARRQMLDERVTPALEAGRDVVCERFHPSTFAYQSAGGGLDEDEVLALLERWAGRPAPDRTLVLELEVPRAIARRGAASDRIEALGEGFLERVAEGYRRYAGRVAGVSLVSASGGVDEVAERVAGELGL